MGLFSWLTGQPDPNGQEGMTQKQKEQYAKNHTDYRDMNCMSCKYLKKDSNGFYCERSVIYDREISEDGRSFKFFDPYTYDQYGNQILLKQNCNTDYWEPRRIDSNGYTICNDCGDVY